MNAAGRHSPNKCPHCGASPRYGLEGHVLRCSRREVVPHSNDEPVSRNTAPASPLHKVTPLTACPNCGKTLKKHGAHFHIRACKGAA